MQASWKTWRMGITSVVLGYFAACAPVKFEEIPPAPCGVDGVDCVATPQGNTYTQEKTVGLPLVDILIVNDNSGSMSAEQKKMGDRFPTFLSWLESEDMDYRIAMTTTDISSADNPADAANGNGSLQDGNLIEFSSSIKYIERSTPNKEDLFYAAVKREETIDCEASGYDDDACPSSDERGIYALNMVLDRTASQFMRPLAHLAIIILSDEDERGISVRDSTYYEISDNEWSWIQKNYPLASYDKPETFVSKLKQTYPGKTVSTHPIIIRPGDDREGCLKAQTIAELNIRGVVGYSYSKLRDLTGGEMGSICDSDYGSTLTKIAEYLADNKLSFPLMCEPKSYQLHYNEVPQANANVSINLESMTFVINEELDSETKVKFSHTCEK